MAANIHLIAGIIGTIVSILLFTSPMLTFKRVIKKSSVEEFSCVPYIITMFSCLVFIWYGTPMVSFGWENSTVVVTSTIGALIESTYVSIYIWFAPREKRKFTVLLVSMVISSVGSTILITNFATHKHKIRKVVVGSIGLVTTLSVYGSPLLAVKQVVKTKSVEFMPFYLSLFTMLSSLIWTVYGLIGRDPIIMVQNGIGCLMGIVQLVIYCIYRNHKAAPEKLRDVEHANTFGAQTILQSVIGKKIGAQTILNQHK